MKVKLGSRAPANVAPRQITDEVPEKQWLPKGGVQLSIYVFAGLEAEMQEAINELRRSLKVTAGSRFNAAKRFEYVDKRMTALMSFSSAYIILLSVAPGIMSVSQNLQHIMNLFNVGLSVILLATSVLSYSGGYAVKAEQYHRSALEMQEIRRRLSLLPKDKVTGIQELHDMYDSVLRKYAINHGGIDFYRYQIQYSNEYEMTKLEVAWKSAQIWFGYHYPEILTALVSVLVFLILRGVFSANVAG